MSVLLAWFYARRPGGMRSQFKCVPEIRDGEDIEVVLDCAYPRLVRIWTGR